MYHSEYGNLSSEIKNSFYVDDLISGDATIDQAFRLYTMTRQAMAGLASICGNGTLTAKENSGRVQLSTISSFI